LVSGIDGLAVRRSYGYGGRDALRHFYAPLFGERLTEAQFFSIVFVVGMAYVVIAGLIIGHTIYHFDRIVGRARQREAMPRLTNWRPVGAGGGGGSDDSGISLPSPDLFALLAGETFAVEEYKL